MFLKGPRTTKMENTLLRGNKQTRPPPCSRGLPPTRPPTPAAFRRAPPPKTALGGCRIPDARLILGGSRPPDPQLGGLRASPRYGRKSLSFCRSPQTKFAPRGRGRGDLGGDNRGPQKVSRVDPRTCIEIVDVLVVSKEAWPREALESTCAETQLGLRHFLAPLSNAEAIS